MKLEKVALDCDISSRLTVVLGELYGSRGFEFVPIKKFIHPSSQDEIWADAFKRFGGRIVISADKQIAHRPHKALALIDNGFAAFFMDSHWSQMAGSMKASHLIYWWPHIEEALSGDVYGRCWKVPCDMREGRLSLYRKELKELRIPDAVLQKTRAAGANRKG